MSLPEPVLYPCPGCGTGRGEGGAPCKQCGWDPNAPITPNPNFPVKTTDGTLQANGRHGCLWKLIVIEMAACAISWFIFVAAISSWPSGQMDHSAYINALFATISVALLCCTSIAASVVFAFTLKTSNGVLKFAALIPLLVSAPGLFIVMAIAVQALSPVQ